jgi:hypothetical protein
MRYLARMLATVFFGVAMAGISTQAQTASVDYDHSVNFLKLKTYTWGKIHATDPQVEQRITLALNRAMKLRYMTEVAKDGDVTVTAVEVSKDPQEYTDFYNSLGDLAWQRPWGNGGLMDAQAAVSDLPIRTLVIDMYDTKTHKLLWRGVMTEPPAKNEDKTDQQMDKAVTQLIGKYPPKYQK